MRHCQSLHVLCSHRPHVHGEGPWRVMVAMTGCSVTSRHLGGLVLNTQIPLHVQVQAEQALQNITAAMEQASGHRQEAAVLKNKLAADQVSLSTACVYVFAYTHTHTSPTGFWSALQPAFMNVFCIQMLRDGRAHANSMFSLPDSC